MQKHIVGVFAKKIFYWNTSYKVLQIWLKINCLLNYYIENLEKKDSKALVEWGKSEITYVPQLNNVG